MRRPRNKNNKAGKYIIIGILAMFSLFGGIALRIYLMLHTGSDNIYSIIEKNIDTSSRQYTLLKEQGRFNILVLGEDDVEGSRRSDTILFVMIDIDDKNMRVVALPRDTRVQIPRHGYQKLNHAYAYGGVDLAKSTIEQYLDQPVLYYFVVDYNSFPSLVNSLGGAEIDVQKRMKYVDRAGSVNIDIQPGLQTLDGEKALNFVRFRMDALGDIGRIQRQQQFMKAMLKRVYDPRNLIKIPEIANEILKLIKTDMQPTLAVQLAGFIQNEIGRDRIFFSTLPGKPVTMDKLSYWLGDTKSIDEFLTIPVQGLISEDLRMSGDKFAGVSIGYSSALDENGRRSSSASSDGQPAQNTQEPEMSKGELIALIKSISEPIAMLNGSGKGGLGSEAATRFQKLGIDVAHSGNAKHFDYKYTNIAYPQNAKPATVDSAKKLGELLGVPNNLVRPNNQVAYPSVIIGHDHATLIAKLDKMLSTALK